VELTSGRLRPPFSFGDIVGRVPSFYSGSPRGMKRISLRFPASSLISTYQVRQPSFGSGYLAIKSRAMYVACSSASFILAATRKLVVINC
jgi:hypothetical protein